MRYSITLLLLVTAAVATSVAAAAARPTLTFMDRDPVVVRGTSFAPSESVTVSVAVFGERRVVRTLRAGERGGFTARFPSIEIERCDTYLIRAVGSLGSRTVIRQHLAPCGAAP